MRIICGSGCLHLRKLLTKKERMKNTFLFAIILTFTFSCGKVNETKKLDSYLHSFGVDLKNYKVVCVVPVDGCSSCITPTLDYSKNAGNDFLLVLSSIYQKSIDYVLEAKNIEKSKIVFDSQNLAASRGLVQIVAPCFYFLKNGHVIKIVDSSTILDKTSVLKEVEQYLMK